MCALPMSPEVPTRSPAMVAGLDLNRFQFYINDKHLPSPYLCVQAVINQPIGLRRRAEGPKFSAIGTRMHGRAGQANLALISSTHPNESRRQHPRTVRPFNISLQLHSRKRYTWGCGWAWTGGRLALPIHLPYQPILYTKSSQGTGIHWMGAKVSSRRKERLFAASVHLGAYFRT